MNNTKEYNHEIKFNTNIIKAYYRNMYLAQQARQPHNLQRKGTVYLVTIIVNIITNLFVLNKYPSVKNKILATLNDNT